MGPVFTTIPRPSRHIDAVLALDVDQQPADPGSAFSARPAERAPGPEWPPADWD